MRGGLLARDDDMPNEVQRLWQRWSSIRFRARCVTITSRSDDTTVHGTHGLRVHDRVITHGVNGPLRSPETL